LYTRSQNDAITDGLTKLYKSQVFSARHAGSNLKNWVGELSLLMIDMDLFKLYNDLYVILKEIRALEMCKLQ
jgi:GGDEF domain-containing protein